MSAVGAHFFLRRGGGLTGFPFGLTFSFLFYDFLDNHDTRNSNWRTRLCGGQFHRRLWTGVGDVGGGMDYRAVHGFRPSMSLLRDALYALTVFGVCWFGG